MTTSKSKKTTTAAKPKPVVKKEAVAKKPVTKKEALPKAPTAKELVSKAVPAAKVAKPKTPKPTTKVVAKVAVKMAESPFKDDVVTKPKAVVPAKAPIAKPVANVAAVKTVKSSGMLDKVRKVFGSALSSIVSK